MNRSRRVKILATLGPASDDGKMILELCKKGADIFRINMSHSNHETLERLVRYIREAEKKVGCAIGILADIQGPKHRLGTFAKGEIEIAPGDVIKLDDNPEAGDAKRVHMPHKDILDALEVGHRILADDGKVRLETVETGAGWVKARVVSGTRLADRKGVNLPDSELSGDVLTAKDRKDLKAVMNSDIDWIGLSFIQRPSDLEEVRALCRGKIGLMAKIEKPQAVQHLDGIIEYADAVMVARGDLGVEMPLEAVPSIQKKIIRKCRKAGKPVVVATQMLDSMIHSPSPTRAEVSDVANAIYEGADAIMLSAESAAGDYPVESVAMMDSIAVSIESDKGYLRTILSQRPEPESTGADAISFAVAQISQTLDLAAIVCYTASGSTGLRVARVRPDRPILALSPVPQTARRLALSWGIRCVITADAKDLDDMVERACRIAKEEKVAKKGERIIITAGVPLSTSGSTNMLRIAYIE